MNDKDRIELVKITARLTVVEQDVAGLKSDMSAVKNDVADMKNDMSEMKRDMVYMRGQIDVIVDLLSSVVSLIKIPNG